MLKKLGNKNKNFRRSSTLKIPSEELTSSVFLRQSRGKFCYFLSSFGGLIQRENVNSSRCIGSEVQNTLGRKRESLSVSKCIETLSTVQLLFDLFITGTHGWTWMDDTL